jgi:hypothetical protein
LEQGLIIGAVLGLGIFLPRLVVERFTTFNRFLRVLLGTIGGGIVMNIAMLMFHILFLNTSPRGLLITVACAALALTFAACSLIRSRPLKMLLSSISIFLAITGTWWIHINLATSQVEWTPVFKYDYTWPLAQVAFTALAVAFSMGILGNLIDLTIREESS